MIEDSGIFNRSLSVLVDETGLDELNT